MESELSLLHKVLKQYDLKPHKSLGQNFLLDTELADKIACCAGDITQGCIIEVGPGLGSLTRSLLKSGAAYIIGIEYDKRFYQVLQELVQAYPSRLQIINANALKVDLSTLGFPPRKIIANLPYNIATTLLCQWLENIQAFESLTLMFQKEVADRLIAQPSTSAYGRLSIITQWLCQVERLFDIPSQAFIPPPKVTSTVIRLVPRPQPLAPADFKILSMVTKAAFGQRRKMLRSSLKSLSGSNTQLLLAKTHIDPTRRSEDLTVAEFCHLAQVFETLKRHNQV